MQTGLHSLIRHARDSASHRQYLVIMLPQQFKRRLADAKHKSNIELPTYNNLKCVQHVRAVVGLTTGKNHNEEDTCTIKWIATCVTEVVKFRAHGRLANNVKAKEDLIPGANHR